MTVDKNLFLHDLAIVAILKNEGHYLKEWLDYHLIAGVDHFYLYDNDSTDNQAEVAAPYVEAGLVDWFPMPGKIMQMAAYNDAFTRFKFQSRYMAFIDGDEFIFPKTGGGISKIVDEVLSRDVNAVALAINWHIFGSNGHETADFSRRVLERFTMRALKNFDANKHVKIIANPRVIKFMSIPHFANYFDELYAVNENGGIVHGAFNEPVTADKIVIQHYYTKSREEYEKKLQRGGADHNVRYSNIFANHDRNDEFDDGILRYVTERAKTFRLPDKSRADERLLTALMVNLSPTLLPNTPRDFYRGKTETFLTCRAVASYLNEKLGDEIPTKFFEEAALKATVKSFAAGANFSDAQIFIRELPNLLKLPYPAVKELRAAALQIIEQLKSVMRINARWKDFVELGYLANVLNE